MISYQKCHFLDNYVIKEVAFGIFQQTNSVESKSEDKGNLYKKISNENNVTKFGLNILIKERKALGIFLNKLIFFNVFLVHCNIVIKEN